MEPPAGGGDAWEPEAPPAGELEPPPEVPDWLAQEWGGVPVPPGPPGGDEEPEELDPEEGGA